VVRGGPPLRETEADLKVSSCRAATPWPDSEREDDVFGRRDERQDVVGQRRAGPVDEPPAGGPVRLQRLVLLVAKERAADLERLTGLIEDGKLVPSVDRSYPPDEAPDAMRLLEQGRVRGKVVITL
jgi:hypothetical protein